MLLGEGYKTLYEVAMALSLVRPVRHATPPRRCLRLLYSKGVPGCQLRTPKAPDMRKNKLLLRQSGPLLRDVTPVTPDPVSWLLS
jgi:hypothetical protein